VSCKRLYNWYHLLTALQHIVSHSAPLALARQVANLAATHLREDMQLHLQSAWPDRHACNNIYAFPFVCGCTPRAVSSAVRLETSSCRLLRYSGGLLLSFDRSLRFLSMSFFACLTACNWHHSR